ncbi:MAG: response regulator [Bacteroidales bacterium]|nr:response regulator [Bacteroidales bacterium]
MKKKILVVEDTSAVREEICDILKMEGFNVSEAVNGKEGLRLAQTVKPNLILTDIVMPEMNGFELYENIAKNSKIQNIPIIFLSANADKDALERAKKMGTGEYIVKPVSPDILIKTITNRINKH